MKKFPNSDNGERDNYYVVPWTGGSPDHAVPTIDISTGSDQIQVGRILRRYWLLLLLLIVVGAAAGVISVVYTSPLYKARVLLEVQGINESWLRNSADAGSGDSSEVHIQTQVQLLREGPFLKRVFDRLQSEVVPLSPAGTDVFSKLRQRVRASTQNDPLQNVRSGLQIALASFTARPVNRTKLIELMCDSISPELASQFLNTMASEFIEETVRNRLQSSQKTSEWLAGQIEETKVKLHEAEERTQEFVQSSGNLFAGQDMTLDDAKLTQLKNELTRIQSDRIQKQTKYELVVKSPPESLPELLDDGVLRALVQKIAEFRREKAALETTYTANYAKVKRIDAQVTVLQTSFQNELNGVISRIRSDYDSALRQEKTLAAAYVQQSQRVSGIAGKAAQHNALKREVETMRQMYQALLMQANQTGLSSSVPVNPVRLVEPSTPVHVPYKPQPVLNISFGVMAGFALTVGIVFIRERLDSSVKSPGLTRSLLQTPELGVIPSADLGRGPKGFLSKLRRKDGDKLNSIRPEAQSTEVSFWGSDSSMLAESFRETLASLLRNSSSVYAPQVILITSAGPGEGKTLVTANLGIALAETGRRVLLVDADFRQPRLHTVFKVSNERALTDLLLEKTPIENYSPELGINTIIPGLTLLPNRRSVQFLSRLLHSSRLPAIIEHLRRGVDTILVDAPPILDLADARILGRMTDAVILVLRSGVTDREQALEAQRRIREDGLQLLGTVLNDWNPSKSRLKRYYSYSDSGDQG